jgi:hypothetical protein
MQNDPPAMPHKAASGPRVATVRGARRQAGENRDGEMWNPIERYRQRQARRRVIPRTVRKGTGRTTKVGIGALLVIVTAAAILEWRGGGTSEAQLVAAVRAEAADPIALIVSGARAHRFVFLSDVAGSAPPKRFAVRVIEALAEDPGSTQSRCPWTPSSNP